jgi:hypothetical protein
MRFFKEIFKQKGRKSTQQHDSIFLKKKKKRQTKPSAGGSHL